MLRLVSRYLFVALAVAALLAGSGPAFTQAQEATPAAEMAAIALPLAPDPALCTAQPRPLAEVRAIYEEVAAGEMATSAAFAEPRGEPADAGTAAAVTAVVVEVIRCNANGGSGLADATFLTEGHLRANLAELTPEEFAAIYTETPQPLPAEQWLMVYAVRDARLLADGRVAANPEIIVPGVGHFRDTLIFAQVDGRWLIDESHEGEPIYLSGE